MNTVSIRRAATAAALALSLAVWSGATRAEFGPGEFVTYTQDGWGAVAPGPDNAFQLLLDNFDSVYPNGLEAGINGPTGFSMVLTGPSAVLEYLPANGGPGSLNVDLVDPTSTNSGLFGGYVVALQLNVGFNDAGVLHGTSATRFGDLTFVDMANVGPAAADYSAFEGLSIRQFTQLMNERLGGGDGAYTFDDLTFLTGSLDAAFEGGLPSGFAQQHLAAPVTAVPEPAAFGLLASGLLVVIAVCRKKSARGPVPAAF